MTGGVTQVWVAFGVSVVLAIAVDLGVFHRKARRVEWKEAVIGSVSWIGLAVCFNVWVYFSRGHRAGLEFLTGYLVEKSLSIDNIFVFLLVFQGLRVPTYAQHKVLYYGVVGALVMRGIFVFAGVSLLRHFHPALYLFGAILGLTVVRMLLPGKNIIKPAENWPVRIVRRMVPMTSEYQGERFSVFQSGSWTFTPLFLALVAVGGNYTTCCRSGCAMEAASRRQLWRS